MKPTKRMGVIELVSETDNPSNDDATGVHESKANEGEKVISFSNGTVIKDEPFTKLITKAIRSIPEGRGSLDKVFDQINNIYPVLRDTDKNELIGHVSEALKANDFFLSSKEMGFEFWRIDPTKIEITNEIQVKEASTQSIIDQESGVQDESNSVTFEQARNVNVFYKANICSICGRVFELQSCLDKHLHFVHSECILKHVSLLEMIAKYIQTFQEKRGTVALIKRKVLGHSTFSRKELGNMFEKTFRDNPAFIEHCQEIHNPQYAINPQYIKFVNQVQLCDVAIQTEDLSNVQDNDKNINDVDVIIEALRELPDGKGTSHEICNQIIKTYPWMKVQNKRNLGKIVMTLSKNDQFSSIKEKRKYFWKLDPSLLHKSTTDTPTSKGDSGASTSEVEKETTNESNIETTQNVFEAKTSETEKEMTNESNIEIPISQSAPEAEQSEAEKEIQNEPSIEVQEDVPMVDVSSAIEENETSISDSFAFDADEQKPNPVKLEPGSQINIKTEPMDNEDVTMKPINENEISTIEELSKTNDKLTNENCEMHQKVFDMDSKILAQEREIKSLKSGRDRKMKIILAKKDEEFNRLKLQLAAEQKKNSELINKLTEKDDKIKSMVEKNWDSMEEKFKADGEKFKAEIIKKEEKFKADETKFKAEITKKDAEISKLKEDYDLLFDENTDLLLRIDDDSLKKQLEDLKEVNQIVIEENKDLKSEIEELKRKVPNDENVEIESTDTSNKPLEELKDENEGLKKENEEMKKKLEEFESVFNKVFNKSS